MGNSRHFKDTLFALRVKVRAEISALDREAPLLPAALLLLIGAGFGRRAQPDIPGTWVAATAVIALLVALSRAAPENISRRVSRRGAAWLVGFALLLAGAWRAHPPVSQPVREDAEPRRYVCLLRGPVRAAAPTWNASAECRPEPADDAESAAVLLRGFGPPPDWTPGARIEADGMLRQAPPPRNFGVTPEAAPPALQLKTLRLTRVLEAGHSPPLGPVRARMAAALASLELAPGLSEAARGMLLGERAALPAPLRGLHQRLSTYHLFILAGLHLGLALLLARGLLRLLPLSPAGCDGLLLGLLAGYFLMLDGEVAARRALCFGALYLLARLTGRERPALNAWALALALEIAVSPATLFTPGFQLSYLASLGMILPPRRAELEPERGPLRRRLQGALLLPWRVAAWLLPAQSLLGPLPLLGPPANGWLFLTGELLLATLWLALLSALCGADRLARLLAHGANHLWALLNGGLELLDRPDWRLAALAWPLAPALLYWLALAACQRLGRWRVFAGVVAGALLFTLLRAPPAPLPARPVLELLDVGQGDALLLSDAGEFFLIDGGRPPAGATVVTALRAHGILRLRGCAATHQDSDHRGGLVAVLNTLHCERLYLPAGSALDPGMAPLLELARARRIPIVMLAAGDRLPFAAGSLRALWPIAGDAGKPNDRGLVLLWENRDFHALLTGDMEAGAERALAPGLPRAALLKVAHHGSKTSSLPEFLAAVHARVGLISVGLNNGYGHPHPQALARLAAADLPLIRTDQRGALRAGRVGDFFKLESGDGAVRYFSLRAAPGFSAGSRIIPPDDRGDSHPHAARDPPGAP